MSTAYFIVLTAGCAFGVLAVALAVFIVLCARRAEKRLKSLLRGETVLLRANGTSFRGSASKLKHLRGAGILALTATRLIFVMWTPRVTLELPLSNVTGTRLEGSLAGQRTLSLAVDFEDRAGNQDSCKWSGLAGEAWAVRVDELRKNQG